MPSKLHTKLVHSGQWAMPEKPFIATLVEDDKVYLMPGAVSKDAVCNYTIVSYIIMLQLQWDRCMLAEWHNWKLLLVKCTEYWLLNTQSQKQHATHLTKVNNDWQCSTVVWHHAVTSLMPEWVEDRWSWLDFHLGHCRMTILCQLGNGTNFWAWGGDWDKMLSRVTLYK